MQTLMVLKLLLSFCSNVDYRHICENNMHSCFKGSIQSNLSNEDAFRVCLDENYINIYDGKYNERK